MSDHKTVVIIKFLVCWKLFVVDHVSVILWYIHCTLCFHPAHTKTCDFQQVQFVRMMLMLIMLPLAPVALEWHRIEYNEIIIDFLNCLKHFIQHYSLFIYLCNTVCTNCFLIISHLILLSSSLFHLSAVRWNRFFVTCSVFFPHLTVKNEFNAANDGTTDKCIVARLRGVDVYVEV